MPFFATTPLRLMTRSSVTTKLVVCHFAVGDREVAQSDQHCNAREKLERLPPCVVAAGEYEDADDHGDGKVRRRRRDVPPVGTQVERDLLVLAQELFGECHVTIVASRGWPDG